MITTMGNWSSLNVTNDFHMLQLESDIISKIIAPTVYAVVTVAGLLGNSLVIYMLLGHTKMKNASNYYILNLALADVLFMLGVPFVSVSSVMGRWVFGRAVCKIVLSVEALNMFSGVFNLAVLSVDRYLAIVCATSHPHLRRPNVASTVSLSVWVAAVLVTIPVIMLSDTALLEDGESYDCLLINWPTDNPLFWYKAFKSYTFIIGFIVPLAVISVSYLMVVRHLRRCTSAHAGVAKATVKMRMKVTKMVTAMIVTFVVCWLPFHLCQLIALTTPLQPTPGVLVLVHTVVAMSYVNSCANPILYAFMSQTFRESFRAALCLTRKNPPTRRASRRTVVNREENGVARSRVENDDFFEEEKCELNSGTPPNSAPQGSVRLFVTAV